MFAPFLQHVPPISFVHKKFLKNAGTVTGNVYCILYRLNQMMVVKVGSIVKH